MDELAAAADALGLRSLKEARTYLSELSSCSLNVARCALKAVLSAGCCPPCPSAAAHADASPHIPQYVERRTGEFLSRLREYSLDEITERNSKGECLLIVDGMILDVTRCVASTHLQPLHSPAHPVHPLSTLSAPAVPHRWLPEHPGGGTIIPGQALGIDSATMFEVYHASRESFLYLKHFYIGELSADSLDRLAPLDPPPSPAFLQQLQQHTPFRLPVVRNGARFKSF